MNKCVLRLGSAAGTFDYGTLRHKYLYQCLQWPTGYVDPLDKIGLYEIVLSAVTIMELLQGMGNKEELARMKKKIRYYDVVQIDEAISAKAVDFIESYKLSHGLSIPDAIIGATAVIHQIPIYTYNIRDFDFLPGIILYQTV
ncbi:MAG: type II toxin-antitoxin system VapC family toxin [Chitinophagales bacterium]|nr:type II toxin-antitoxin system VapC family toxin [Chitinophagales bacterium]